MITAKIGPRDSGVFKELSKQLKLILRLLADRRVHPLLKVIPLASLIYLVMPADLMPLLPFDDALIVWLSTVLFVELCPPDVVDEHRKALEGVVQGKWRDTTPPAQEEIIEGEFKDQDRQDKG
jgi:uncharacterized membrane protein YkvA (DUF1232 family)